MEKEEVRKIIQDNIRNQIELDIKENNDGVAVISSKIGGKPSVPADFEWPKYHAKWFEEGESRPLTFWAQFNLEEVSKYDKDGILPKKGILSFFYCLTEDELFWGTNPSEKALPEYIILKTYQAWWKRSFLKTFQMNSRFLKRL